MDGQDRFPGGPENPIPACSASPGNAFGLRLHGHPQSPRPSVNPGILPRRAELSTLTNRVGDY